jgi:hypothetical protein
LNVDESAASRQTQPPSFKNRSHHHGGIKRREHGGVVGRIAAPVPHITRGIHKLLESDVPVTVPAVEAAPVVGGVLEEQGVAGGEWRALRCYRIPPVSLVYSDVALMSTVEKTLLTVQYVRQVVVATR